MPAANNDNGSRHMEQPDQYVKFHGKCRVLRYAFSLGQTGAAAEGTEYGAQYGLLPHGKAGVFGGVDADGHFAQARQQCPHKRA